MFGKIQTKCLMNWTNRKVLIKRTNRTEFKATNVIAKRYRKKRKEVDVLITLQMIFLMTTK